MNLTTNYLGLTLRNPLIIGASPCGDSTFIAHQLQDSGAAAIVMRSLFEEQIEAEQRALVHHTEAFNDSHADGTSYFPKYNEYQLAPEQYLRQLEHLKKTLAIPVIGSLNGCRPGGWISYARRIEAAGADALELNLYRLVTDPLVTGDDVEADMLDTVRNVASAVKIPVAVKLSPFHTSPAQFAVELEKVGARGVVLFNRFYQPDFKLEDLEVHAELKLSESSELLMRLRWLAIISPHLRASLSATGGIHSTEDIVKAILAGADTVQLVSVVLRNGPRILSTLLSGLTNWLRDHDYESLEQLRGAMNLQRCPDPAAFERANYIRILQSWKV